MVEKQRISREFYNNALKELNHLRDVEKPENDDKLKSAREQGDLSENAEYSEARDRQARIDARIKELEALVYNSVILEDEVYSNNLGKIITIIYTEDGETEEFKLIDSSAEADPLSGKVSTKSPLGREVLNANIGEERVVKPEVGKEFTIVITNIRKG